MRPILTRTASPRVWSQSNCSRPSFPSNSGILRPQNKMESRLRLHRSNPLPENSTRQRNDRRCPDEILSPQSVNSPSNFTRGTTSKNNSVLQASNNTLMPVEIIPPLLWHGIRHRHTAVSDPVTTEVSSYRAPEAVFQTMNMIYNWSKQFLKS